MSPVPINIPTGMIQRGLQSMVPSPLCPPTSEPGGSRPPEDSQLAVSAPGAVCRRKRRGKGWGQAQWPPGPRPWGNRESGQARICVSCSQGSLPTNSPIPSTPTRAVTLRSQGESHSSSFLHFPQEYFVESTPEIHLFTVDVKIRHQLKTTLSSSTRRSHCPFQRKKDVI